jgi:hypothetical protein
MKRWRRHVVTVMLLPPGAVERRSGEVTSMKGWPVRVAMLFLFGAIVNVAVATGLAWALEPDWQRASLLHFGELCGTMNDGEGRWRLKFQQLPELAVVRLPTSGETGSKQWKSPGLPDPYWGSALTSAQLVLLNDGTSEVRCFSALGWPDGAIWWEYRSRSVYPTTAAGAPGPFISSATFDPATSQFLPHRPIWHGFATNTVFYAAVLGGVWLLFFAPFAIRRWVFRARAKRGLCPVCAYPVGENDVCTECGKPVIRKGLG